MKRKFLTDLGITDSEIIKAIIDFHQGVVNDFKDDIKDLNENITALKKKKPEDSGEDWQAKYEKMKEDHDKVKADFDVYKQTVETNKLSETKKAAIKKLLLENGANPDEDIIGLLQSKIDLEKIELDGDTVKGGIDVIKPVQESHAKWFGKVKTQGAGVATPPGTTETQTKTTVSDVSKNLNAHRIIGG